MSTFTVPVVTIESIRPHLNADSLELATVLGWQVVIPKGTYHEGEKAVYFQPDTVLTKELSDELGVTRYLSHGRIRCTRLRGEPSFGILCPCKPEWAVGDNVAAHYAASKYEPPVRHTHATREHTQPDDTLPESPLFPRYTNIENMRNYPSVLMPGESVVVTEKIHGCSSRVGMINGILTIGSHNVTRKIPDLEVNEWANLADFTGKNRYLYPFSLASVRHLLTTLSTLNQYRQVILYGEIYGASVQSLSYGKMADALGYRAFDLLVDGKFVDHETFQHVCAIFDVPVVPVLDILDYDLSIIRNMAAGNTTLQTYGHDHMREGVVVRPLAERHDRRVGRVILKYVSDTYLLNKNITDYAEQ